MRKKKITLDADTLDRVWSEWLIDNNKIVGNPFRKTRYRYYTGYNDLQISFKLWLQDHGATIRKDHREYVIEFQNPEHATFFILKYT